VGLLALAALAVVLARFRPTVIRERPPVTARDWRRHQLIEARRKIEEIRQKGQAREDDVLERLAEIDRQVAALDRADQAAARPVAASPPPPKQR
jgi:hypothetical protein